VCAVSVNGRELLASGGYESVVRIWDPATGEQLAALEGHERGVRAVCAVSVNGRELLASAGGDRTVRIWDPQTGTCVLAMPTYHAASAITWVAESLAIGLDTGLIVIKPAPVLRPSGSR